MKYEDVKALISCGENICVEFKRAGNGLENDAYETVCSFANRLGGDILCGVLDDGSIVGVNESAIPSLINNFISIISNPAMFSPTLFIVPDVIDYEGKKIVHIHVPNSSEVHTYKKVIYDRINDSDVKLTSTGMIASLYIRKQNIYTERKIYKHVELCDLREDLIHLCRQRAINKRSDHPWRNLSDIELLKSAKLFAYDYETGEKGFNLASILLLGKDEVIGSICPQHKTDAIMRRVNVDRYDDRDIIQTNLIESFDLLMNFSKKHLSDKFYMEGAQTISVRDKIVREMISNTLVHREYTSPYVSKYVIETDRVYTENVCRAFKAGKMTPESFSPISKNPIIASFFTSIGNADELGSGTRNLFKYAKIYSGKNPEMIEGDIFRTIVPLNDGYSCERGRFYYQINEDSVYLSDNQMKILDEIRKNSSVTAKLLSNLIGISERKIQENMRILKEKNLIARIGSNKTGKWIIL